MLALKRHSPLQNRLCELLQAAPWGLTGDVEGHDGGELARGAGHKAGGSMGVSSQALLSAASTFGAIG